jgi:hypothetical protein
VHPGGNEKIDDDVMRESGWGYREEEGLPQREQSGRRGNGDKVYGRRVFSTEDTENTEQEKRGKWLRAQVGGEGAAAIEDEGLAG